MSIQSLANFQAQTAPAGLLALNTGRNAVRHGAVTAVRAFQGMSPEAMGSTVRIGLPHMDVVLSISAEPGGGAAPDAGFAIPASDAMPADPVMERLLRQLGQADGDDDHDGVHGDAIRLALVARWLRLHSQSVFSEVQEDATDGALQKWRLRRVMTYVDEHIGETISLADLARTAGFSRMYFAARFQNGDWSSSPRIYSASPYRVGQGYACEDQRQPCRDCVQCRLPDPGSFHDSLQALRRYHSRPVALVQSPVRLRSPPPHDSHRGWFVWWGEVSARCGTSTGCLRLARNN